VRGQGRGRKEDGESEGRGREGKGGGQPPKYFDLEPLLVRSHNIERAQTQCVKGSIR